MDALHNLVVRQASNGLREPPSPESFPRTTGELAGRLTYRKGFGERGSPKPFLGF